MTMVLTAALEAVQIPVLAVMLLAASVTKAVQLRRGGPPGEAPGPTAFFPVSARRPVAGVICAVEFCLSVGLIVTAGRDDVAAKSVRGAAGVLFVVATCALIELRAVRPDAGCGCFGELSTTPVSLRTTARPALLAAAALAAINARVGAIDFSLRPVSELVGLLIAELLVIALLSPEIGEGLIRLGYSEPCELQNVPSQRTLAALHRSRQWRRYAPLVTSADPADMWREMCWRYVVYPASYHGDPSDLVFAVFLQHRRRPAIRAAVVDARTGQTLPWPEEPAPRWRPFRGSPSPDPEPVLAAASVAAPDDAVSLPVSTDV